MELFLDIMINNIMMDLITIFNNETCLTRSLNLVSAKLVICFKILELNTITYQLLLVLLTNIFKLGLTNLCLSLTLKLCLSFTKSKRYKFLQTYIEFSSV